MMLSFQSSNENSSKSSSSSSDSGRYSCGAIYASMLLLAIVAGAMDWEMQAFLMKMSHEVQTALRITAVDLLQHLDGIQLHTKAVSEHKEAESLEETALAMEEKSKKEEGIAIRSRHRGEIFQKLAIRNQLRADEMYDNAHRDADLRNEILANMTRDEDEQKETLAELRKIHQGPCNWTVVSSVCQAVGGIAGLQQRADAESIRIHAEWSQAASVGKQELMEEMVAKMIQGKADQYNRTATDLLRVAEAWDERAQLDFETYLEENSTAYDMEEEAEEMEGQAEKKGMYEISVEMEAQGYLHHAQLDHVRAYWCAILGVACALCPLFYFATQALPKSVKMLETWTAPDPSRSSDVWQSLSYFIQHSLLYLDVVGSTGDYFVHVEKYTASERAVIVVWFAFQTAMMQTFFLHAVPRFLDNMVRERTTPKMFLLDMGKRLFCLFSAIVLEVLLVWLSLGHSLYSASLVHLFNSYIFDFFVIGSVVGHLYFFEVKRVMGESSALNESETVWHADEPSFLSQESSIASEATPLRKEDLQSTLTPIDVRNTRERDTSLTDESTVREGMMQTMKDNFRPLVLPFEVLMIACMLAVLRNCVRILWISQATVSQYAVLLCALLLLILGMVLVKDLTCDECYELGQGRAIRRRSQRKMEALELVQV